MFLFVVIVTVFSCLLFGVSLFILEVRAIGLSDPPGYLCERIAEIPRWLASVDENEQGLCLK